MHSNLCETFRALAFRTYDQLSKARAVNYQPLEETLTDVNILELKYRHPSEVYSRTFNKREEGVNGADWEWWLTNSQRNQWLGMRVQAKILYLAKNNFPHLHYSSGNPKISQLTKLRRQAFKDGLVPLYCFFTHISSTKINTLHNYSCLSFPNALETYGCALTSLSHIESLQKQGKNDLNSVLSGAMPWHCLVCCNGYTNIDLPTNAWNFLKNVFFDNDIKKDNLQDRQNSIGLRIKPPSYVLSILNGIETEDIDHPVDVKGIVIIAPSSSHEF